MRTRSILVVDDDEIFRTRLMRAFEDRGLRAFGASSGDAALEIVRKEIPDLALVDLRMPGMPGLDLAAALAALEPPPRIVVLTGYGSIATALEAVRCGASHYLTKPADADEILAAFDRDTRVPEKPLEEPSDVPSLARAEWEHINRVLADCGGNVSKAARLLGIHRRSLQRKLAKYPTAR